ncbi:MAG: preprotein translocase subunit YajC [Parahaliea sp.]
MSLFIASAHAQTAGAPAQQQGADLFGIVFMVGLFALFYFIAIRPQRKRQKEHEAMVSALNKGDEVVTTAGILGRISALDEHYVVLTVADKVEMKFQRMHVHAVLPKGTLKSIAA